MVRTTGIDHLLGGYKPAQGPGEAEDVRVACFMGLVSFLASSHSILRIAPLPRARSHNAVRTSPHWPISRVSSRRLHLSAMAIRDDEESLEEGQEEQPVTTAEGGIKYGKAVAVVILTVAMMLTAMVRVAPTNGRGDV